jgi:hypothetical protein
MTQLGILGGLLGCGLMGSGKQEIEGAASVFLASNNTVANPICFTRGLKVRRIPLPFSFGARVREDPEIAYSV